MTTDFLFARPNFLRGVGSILDLGGKKLYNGSESEVEADTRALLSDWLMVGGDLMEALDVYGREK